MQLTSKIKILDDALCAYISTEDPLKKAAVNNVFMNKKQLSAFYTKMISKANQQLDFERNRNFFIDKDKNNLLKKQEQRRITKICNRTFHNNRQKVNIVKLKQKLNFKINAKPMISETSFKTRSLIGKQDSKLLSLANQQLFMTEFCQKSQNKKMRINKSSSHSLRTSSKGFRNFHQIDEEKGIQDQSAIFTSNDCLFQTSIIHERTQLIQLYQKLYQQFTKQKLNNAHCRSRIQSKFVSIKNQAKSCIFKKQDLNLINANKRLLLKI